MQASYQSPIRFSEALQFPFQQTDGIKRVWWLILANYIPFFGLILIRGWRVDVVRRMGRNDSDILPVWEDIGRFLKDGLLLWCMTLIYIIPQVVILFIFDFETVEFVAEVLWWLYLHYLTDTQTVPFSVLLASAGIKVLIELLFPFFYYLVSWPMYRVAMIRYSVTGKVLAFFDIFTNIKFLLKHCDGFMLVFVLTLATQFLIGFMSGLFALTVIGTALIPLVSLPLYYWTTGHLYGKLAMRLSLVSNQEAQTA